MPTALRILVTNDDGIHAPGLVVLEKIARSLSKDVWVVAPEIEQSGASHSLSIRTPLRARKLSPKRFAVGGTPTDCVLMAVGAIVPGRIDLVLSGVNRGGNVAEDIMHSGTAAAAMEGALCDIPSIALSQLINYDDPDAKVYWQTAAKHAPDLIRRLLAGPWEKDTMINVNFPHCPPDKVKGVKVVEQGRRTVKKQLTRAVDPGSRPYYWLHWGDEGADLARPDSDIHWMYKDYVTVTPIHLNLTHYGLLGKLKESLRA
jgi:5'-nucleotidase